jgi:hypothetical protein
MAPVDSTRPRGIVIAASLMMLFGFAEVVTAFTHSFLGISTSGLEVFSYLAAALGSLYAAAGLLVLTMTKRAATYAIALLLVDIVGRVALVLAGLYPMNSHKQVFAIVVGTSLVAAFAVYIKLRWDFFR